VSSHIHPSGREFQGPCTQARLYHILSSSPAPPPQWLPKSRHEKETNRHPRLTVLCKARTNGTHFQKLSSMQNSDCCYISQREVIDPDHAYGMLLSEHLPAFSPEDLEHQPLDFKRRRQADLKHLFSHGSEHTKYVHDPAKEFCFNTSFHSNPHIGPQRLDIQRGHVFDAETGEMKFISTSPGRRTEAARKKFKSLKLSFQEVLLKRRSRIKSFRGMKSTSVQLSKCNT